MPTMGGSGSMAYYKLGVQYIVSNFIKKNTHNHGKNILDTLYFGVWYKAGENRTESGNQHTLIVSPCRRLAAICFHT